MEKVGVDARVLKAEISVGQKPRLAAVLDLAPTLVKCTSAVERVWLKSALLACGQPALLHLLPTPGHTCHFVRVVGSSSCPDGQGAQVLPVRPGHPTA